MKPTPPSDVGEILERLVTTTQPYHRIDGSPPPHVLPEHYEQARSTLLALLVSRMPEKKYTPLDIGNKHPNRRAELMEYIIGYNAALKDTVSVLNGLFGGKE